MGEPTEPQPDIKKRPEGSEDLDREFKNLEDIIASAKKMQAEATEPSDFRTILGLVAVIRSSCENINRQIQLQKLRDKRDGDL